MAFTIFMWKSNAATIQMWLLYTQYSKDNVYAYNLEIYCNTNQVQQLFKVQCLTK